MASWAPTTDFEEEIVSLQPDHNFIYGDLCQPGTQTFYPRPKPHLDFVTSQKNNKIEECSESKKLRMISKVESIARTKPLGQQSTLDDWNTDDNIEHETIAMMRHCGLGPSIDAPLDERRTIATYPINKSVQITRNGMQRVPILFDEKFFKLVSPTDLLATDQMVADDLDKQCNSTSESDLIGDCSYDKLDHFDDGARRNSSSVQNESMEKNGTSPEDTSDDYIRSRSWYSKSSSSIGSSDSACVRNNRHKFENSNAPIRLTHQPQQQHFYTAKELYEKKRKN